MLCAERLKYDVVASKGGEADCKIFIARIICWELARLLSHHSAVNQHYKPAELVQSCRPRTIPGDTYSRQTCQAKTETFRLGRDLPVETVYYAAAV